MTDYLVSVDEQHDKVLQWLVNTLNTEQNTNVTVLQYLNRQVPELLRPYVLRFKAYKAELVRSAYEDADETAQAAVEQALGI